MISIFEKKHCSKCKIEKGLNNFALRKDSSDKRSSVCKECFNSIYNLPLEKSIITEKKCTECKEIKAIEEFQRDRHSATGRGFKCKSCKKAIREKSLDEKRKYSREWREKNKESHRIQVKFHGYKKMGIDITEDEYYELYNSQHGKCAICECEKRVDEVSLCLDHDHTTGKPRGFLCHNCNRAIGLLKDSPELLAKAAEYLTIHQIDLTSILDIGI